MTIEISYIIIKSLKQVPFNPFNGNNVGKTDSLKRKVRFNEPEIDSPIDVNSHSRMSSSVDIYFMITRELREIQIIVINISSFKLFTLQWKTKLEMGCMEF